MQIVFLPGAAGAPEFWHPLGALLPASWEKVYLYWPGLGDQPHEAGIDNFDDLVAWTISKFHGPSVIVAQSMGGIVGVRLALAYPERVTHLVLAATSGGMGISALGGVDWRASYLSRFPNSRPWIAEAKPDHSREISNIKCPTLLLWGDSDAISPVSVGKRLSELIGHSTLEVIKGGNHDLGKERAAEVAAFLVDYLSS